MENKYLYALGFFDGVHLGHEALLRKCRAMAAPLGLIPGAVTFDTHPKALVRGKPPVLINTPADREWILRHFGGMERVETLRFDERMHTLPWEDFLELLIREYGAAGFVCGYDYRCGYLGRGNAERLEAFARHRGLPFAVVPEQTLEGVRISSTYIREQLEEGNLSRAVKFLGHPHVVGGTVENGALRAPEGVLALPRGTYRTKEGAAVESDGKTLKTALPDGEARLLLTE